MSITSAIVLYAVIWAIVFYFFFAYTQSMFSMIVVGIAGCGRAVIDGVRRRTTNVAPLVGVKSSMSQPPLQTNG